MERRDFLFQAAALAASPVLCIPRGLTVDEVAEAAVVMGKQIDVMQWHKPLPVGTLLYQGRTVFYRGVFLHLLTPACGLGDERKPAGVVLGNYKQTVEGLCCVLIEKY